MKNSVFILLIAFYSTFSFAQSEFKTYDNGLIYNSNTMNKLSKIVDSLNLKFKLCDLDKTYYTISQTVGHRIELEEGNILEAKNDIESKISFDDFMKKYPKAIVEKEVLIIKYKYKNYSNKEVVEFSEVSFEEYSGIEITKNDSNLYNSNFEKNWVFRYNSKTDYSKESIDAFYFTSDFSSKPIIDKYSKMISYADCLIDTTSSKIKEDAVSGYVELPKNWQNLSQKNKEKLLDKMRSTNVVGGCSQDDSPRIHAINIALLSAETFNWEVFLKAHLDIMNDRFDRVSDGSYAWKGRNTYIREIENLNINTIDLLIGISLRIENPSNNHYFGSVGRIGRAISETQNIKEFENTLLSMIEDSELDYYNRVIAYYLFLNYINYSTNKVESENKKVTLLASVEKMPQFIKSRIKL
jgi:hypothetical protein